MIGRVLYWRGTQRLRALARAGREPEEVQRELLLRLVRSAERTRFGQEHGFASIRRVEDYRERVPLQDYASLAPYLERARDGAADECWPGVPECFAKTPGTTGGGKVVPHTKQSLQSHLDGAFDALAAYLARAEDRHLLRAKIAFLGGSVALRRFPSGIAWGDNTGIVAGRAPAWVRPFRVPSPEVLALDDWGEKIERAAEELAATDVRLLIGTPSWSLLLLDAVEEATDRPIRDVWPSWRGFLHGGMAFPPYAETYRKRAGEGIVFVETYTATEGGVLAVQDRPDDPSLAVVLDRGAYLEFVPAGEPAGPRLGLHEVEPGRPYAVCVTTDAGLWSYRLGDLVRFTSLRPPRLVFHGREGFTLDAFGENVSQEELEGAVAAAAAEHGCEVREFAVLPEFPDARRSRGRHVWLVEFGFPPADLRAFAGTLDATLRRANHDYAAHRTGDRQLRFPHVRLVRRGTFHGWLKERARDGALTQVPRLVDRGQARELLGRAGGGRGARP